MNNSMARFITIILAAAAFTFCFSQSMSWYRWKNVNQQAWEVVVFDVTSRLPEIRAKYAELKNIPSTTTTTTSTTTTTVPRNKR